MYEAFGDDMSSFTEKIKLNILYRFAFPLFTKLVNKVDCFSVMFFWISEKFDYCLSLNGV